MGVGWGYGGVQIEIACLTSGSSIPWDGWKHWFSSDTQLSQMAPKPFLSHPRGLTITWWGYYSLCFYHKPTQFAYSFLFCSCAFICLYGPFSCISFHKFSHQFSVSSFSFSGLISALLALSTTYLFIKVSLNGLRDVAYLPCNVTLSGEDGILEIEVSTDCSLFGPVRLFGPDFSWIGSRVGSTQSICWSC